MSARRRSIRATAFVASVFTCSTFAVEARAQTADANAAAEDLFQRAKAMMVNRLFETACPLLAESYRLDPGGGTLQNLAICYEELGKWASAYARFHELQTLSQAAKPPRPDRIKLANEHLAKLEPRLMRLRIVSAEPQVEVDIDGVHYLRPAWSVGVLVDPGEHTVVASAQAKQPFTTRVTTSEEGTTRDVRIPPLVDVPTPVAPLAAKHDPVLVETSPLRPLGFVLSGVGVAALGTGLVFGLLAINANSSGKAECSGQGPGFDPVTRQCLEGSSALGRANDLKGDARLYANVANVLVPLGLVSIGVGAYFVFFHREQKVMAKRSSGFDVSLSRATLAGTF